VTGGRSSAARPVQRPGAAQALLATLLVLSGTAACLAADGAGHGTTAAQRAPATMIDACTLLLPSEIAEVIGFAVDVGIRKDAGFAADGSYSSACVWTVDVSQPPAFDANAPLGGQSFVILHVIRWPAGSGLARTFLESFRAAAASGEIPAQPVARDYGDEALWWGDGLAVRSADVGFGVSVFLPALARKSTGAHEERLAPAILRRLAEPSLHAR